MALCRKTKGRREKSNRELRVVWATKPALSLNSHMALGQSANLLPSKFYHSLSKSEDFLSELFKALYQQIEITVPGTQSVLNTSAHYSCYNCGPCPKKVLISSIGVVKGSEVQTASKDDKVFCNTDTFLTPEVTG